MDEAIDFAHEFFRIYTDALLARDADGLADLYAVPALIAFPQQSIVVTDAAQTREFFASSWEQYHGVTEVEPAIEVLSSCPHSIWADVEWTYDGEPRERFVYQLLNDGDRWQVGVLTPLSAGS